VRLLLDRLLKVGGAQLDWQVMIVVMVEIAVARVPLAFRVVAVRLTVGVGVVPPLVVVPVPCDRSQRGEEKKRARHMRRRRPPRRRDSRPQTL
jgi:hypothetical protein